MFKFVWLLAIPLISQSAIPHNGSYPVSDNSKFTAQEKIYHYILGNTQVGVLVAAYGDRRNIVMLNLHDDEVTSMAAARNVLKTSGGILVNINNNYERRSEERRVGKE